MEIDIELGGFAENPEDVDGNFEAFNYCLASEYVNALFNEDFDIVGSIDSFLFNNICYWYNYKKSIGNEKEVKELEEASFITVNNRTIIDAIYDKKYISLANVYLDNKIYSPKLLLTMLLGEDENIVPITYISVDSREDIDNILKKLYDFIEEEYLKQENKKDFLNKIKNNIGRIRLRPKPTPMSGYTWVKELSKI